MFEHGEFVAHDCQEHFGYQIFAVLFGLVAAYAAKNYLQEKEVQAAEAQVETISVPMAVTAKLRSTGLIPAASGW